MDNKQSRKEDFSDSNRAVKAKGDVNRLWEGRRATSMDNAMEGLSKEVTSLDLR